MPQVEDFHMHQKLVSESFLLLSDLLSGRRSLVPVQKWRVVRRNPHELGHRDQAVVPLMSWLGGQLPGDVFQVELFCDGGGYDYIVSMIKLPGGTFKGVIHFGHVGQGMTYLGYMLWIYNPDKEIRRVNKVRVLQSVELRAAFEWHVERVDFIPSDN